MDVNTIKNVQPVDYFIEYISKWKQQEVSLLWASKRESKRVQSHPPCICIGDKLAKSMVQKPHGVHTIRFELQIHI